MSPRRKILKPEREHDDHDDGLADHAAQGQPLDEKAHQEERQKPDANRGRQGQAKAAGEPGDEIAAGHDERTLSKVRDAGSLVNQDDAERAKRVHQSDQRAIDRKLGEESPIHYAVSKDTIESARCSVPFSPVS